MLFLILTRVQYFQNVVFSFEKGLNGQNHFLSGTHRGKKIQYASVISWALSIVHITMELFNIN